MLDSRMKAPKYFFTNVKRHGALLTKGRMLGIQFDTLFTDELYFKISKHAINMAAGIRKIFAKHNILVTSWATKEGELEELDKAIEKCMA